MSERADLGWHRGCSATEKAGDGEIGRPTQRGPQAHPEREGRAETFTETETERSAGSAKSEKDGLNNWMRKAEGTEEK